MSSKETQRRATTTATTTARRGNCWAFIDALFLIVVVIVIIVTVIRGIFIGIGSIHYILQTLCGSRSLKGGFGEYLQRGMGGGIPRYCSGFFGG